MFCQNNKILLVSPNATKHTTKSDKKNSKEQKQIEVNYMQFIKYFDIVTGSQEIKTAILVVF